MFEADEIKYILKEKEQFINKHNEAKNALLILVFVDGEYAGNCFFESKVGSGRISHREGMRIALLQKYTGFGLRRLMLERLLIEIKNLEFQQAELTVAGGNNRAYHCGFGRSKIQKKHRKTLFKYRLEERIYCNRENINRLQTVMEERWVNKQTAERRIEKSRKTAGITAYSTAPQLYCL